MWSFNASNTTTSPIFANGGLWCAACAVEGDKLTVTAELWRIAMTKGGQSRAGNAQPNPWMRQQRWWRARAAKPGWRQRGALDTSSRSAGGQRQFQHRTPPPPASCVPRAARLPTAIAVATVASPHVVSMTRWHDFGCLFSSVADVFVGSSLNPWWRSTPCPWTFIRLEPRTPSTPWGQYVIVGLRTVWQSALSSFVHRFRWFVYARVDMQWVADPRLLLRSLLEQWAGATSRALAFVPDTEHYWGVNDRFAICTRPAAEAYFASRAELLPKHSGNTETLLAAALKAAKASVLWLPTLGMLPCCTIARECHDRGGSGVCVRLRIHRQIYSVKFVLLLTPSRPTVSIYSIPSSEFMASPPPEPGLSNSQTNAQVHF